MPSAHVAQSVELSLVRTRSAVQIRSWAPSNNTKSQINGQRTVPTHETHVNVGTIGHLTAETTLTTAILHAQAGVSLRKLKLTPTLPKGVL